MAISENLNLRWDDFAANLSSALHNLRGDENFTDLTLVCADQQVEAHKVVLASSSKFFWRVLKKIKHSHPLIYLKGVKFKDLEAVLSFMYLGQINLAHEDLDSFLALAEELEVNGLTPGEKVSKANSNRQNQGKSCAEQLHKSTPSQTSSVLPKPNLAPNHTPSKTHTVQKNPKVTVTPNATPIQAKQIAPFPQQLTPAPIANPSISTTQEKQNMLVGIQSLGATTVTIKNGQLIVQGPDHATATKIAQLLSTGAAEVANFNGKQVLLTNAEASGGQQQTGATSTAPTPPPTPQEPTPSRPPREPSSPQRLTSTAHLLSMDDNSVGVPQIKEEHELFSNIQMGEAMHVENKSVTRSPYHLRRRKVTDSLLVSAEDKEEFKSSAGLSELERYCTKIYVGADRGKYKCGLCGHVSQCKRKNVMLHHLEIKHFPGMFQYSCESCDLVFDTIYKYRHHRNQKHSNKAMSE